MTVLRTDIERALNELVSQEEGMRFQGLAVILGKKRWPELISRQRKKDRGLDAYAPASETTEKVGKGLAASITATIGKISGDVKTAIKEFPDLKKLLFVTSQKIGNAPQKSWIKEIQTNFDIELIIIEREEIITQMLMPENTSLRASFLHLDNNIEPQVTDIMNRTRRAAKVVTQTWARNLKGSPLIPLSAARLEPNGAESSDVLSLEQIHQALSQSRHIVLEGPAGCGKTTTLIQLAEHARTTGIALMIDLPAWSSSRREILEYIASMPAFRAEEITAVDLARVQQTETLLLLLNGWNEIKESNSEHATHALRELERNFPSAGIIVATRSYHLTPPLPGALRLRLMRLLRAQRATYLVDRLGAKAAELHTRIVADPSLDELTRTPFILSEVASLFQAGLEIPSTKLNIIAQVLNFQEHRDEHKNALQSTPIFGHSTDYLIALATQMIQHGAVTLPEAESRTTLATVGRQLAANGQIEPVGAPSVLATLTAHHLIERFDYPETIYQFEHQQIQEYYCAIGIRGQLLSLRDDDHEAITRFTAEYVNKPAWAEPLFMVAASFAKQTENDETNKQNTRAGVTLIKMALAVDLVFAGELVRFCGATIWNEVRMDAGKRFRSVYACHENNFGQYALAAMLATGMDDFSDIIIPIFSGQDQQTRLHTYRLWPDIEVSSLGLTWREQIKSWNEEAQVDFVSELLHHRVNKEIVDFSLQNNSTTVKKAVVSALIWTKSDGIITRALDSLDTQTFEDVALMYPDRMPAVFKSKTITIMRNFIESNQNPIARLQAALHLIKFGETGLDRIIKDAIVALPAKDIQNLSSHTIEPIFKYLLKTDPTWINEWVTAQVAEGVLYKEEYWLSFTTTIPDSLIEKYLQRLETEDLKNVHFGGMIAVITTHADAKLAARVFEKLRELQNKMDVEPGKQHEFEWQVMLQLNSLFHQFSDEIAVAGILLSVRSGDTVDIKIAADILSRVARTHKEPIHINDDDLKARLRAYLKSGIVIVLRQDDFNGEVKANLASSIAQVGKPEDMVDMVTLIRADIERMRCVDTAFIAGNRGTLSNGGRISYARWHIEAVMQLDSTGAEQVLIDLLTEPEYTLDAANGMACDYLPKSELPFNRTLHYGLMWAARKSPLQLHSDHLKRKRFSTALNLEINRLQKQNQDARITANLKGLAKALAAIDGYGSAAVLLEIIALPCKFNEYADLVILERLLIAGVNLPVTTVFALIDSILQRTEKWIHDSDKDLLLRLLKLCPFIEDPVAGISKISDVLSKRRLLGHELCEIVTALGESRTDAAIDLLYELASNSQIFVECESNFINAFAKLDMPTTRELLMSFIKPNTHNIPFTVRLNCEDVLVARLTELAQRRPEMATQLLRFCTSDLSDQSRDILSKVMNQLGTPEAFAANLDLIDDSKPMQVPHGFWDQLENAFIEQRPYGKNVNSSTIHGCQSNELRARLFKMAIEDTKRQKSAFRLLGQIEVWRLENGKPSDEPRHPDFSSGHFWPSEESYSSY